MSAWEWDAENGEYQYFDGERAAFVSPFKCRPTCPDCTGWTFMFQTFDATGGVQYEEEASKTYRTHVEAKQAVLDLFEQQDEGDRKWEAMLDG